MSKLKRPVYKLFLGCGGVALFLGGCLSGTLMTKMAMSPERTSKPANIKVTNNVINTTDLQKIAMTSSKGEVVETGNLKEIYLTNDPEASLENGYHFSFTNDTGEGQLYTIYLNATMPENIYYQGDVGLYTYDIMLNDEIYSQSINHSSNDTYPLYTLYVGTGETVEGRFDLRYNPYAFERGIMVDELTDVSLDYSLAVKAESVDEANASELIPVEIKALGEDFDDTKVFVVTISDSCKLAPNEFNDTTFYYDVDGGEISEFGRIMMDQFATKDMSNIVDMAPLSEGTHTFNIYVTNQNRGLDNAKIASYEFNKAVQYTDIEE